MYFQIIWFIFILTVTTCKSTDDLKSTLKADVNGAAQMQRFQVWIDVLKKALPPGASVDKAVDELLGGQNRVAAFNLQALGRLYENDDRLFKSLRSRFKELEDSIGEYNKWLEISDAAARRRAGRDEVRSLESKKIQAKESLKELLQRGNWVAPPGKSELEKIEANLKSFRWVSYEADKQNMLKQLIKQLKKVGETQYDLSHLEEGKGLHELRRELRWFLIKARVLNGMVTFKQGEQCPIAHYGKLGTMPIASSKYSQLVPSSLEITPCSISRCLFLGLVDMTEELGSAKDAAEQRNINSDLVPQSMREKAERKYGDMIRLRLIDATVSELKTCGKR